MEGVSGAVCARGGADKRSWGHDLAIIRLAASPYDHQAKLAATPPQNTIRKRDRSRE
jgi:hypothetical protein